MTERYRAAQPRLIEQTAILRDIDVPEVTTLESAEQVAVSFTNCAYAVVLHQECDLQLDRLARAGEPSRPGGSPVKQDKKLRAILLCPAFSADHVTAGTYIEGATEYRGSEVRAITQNHNDRFHYLSPEGTLLIEPLILDFKLVMAAHPDYLQAWVNAHPDRVIAVMEPPFRDRLIQRFANFFSRIAEPED